MHKPEDMATTVLKAFFMNIEFCLLLLLLSQDLGFLISLSMIVIRANPCKEFVYRLLIQVTKFLLYVHQLCPILPTLNEVALSISFISI